MQERNEIMTNKRTRAVAYLRVSSQRQVIDGHGLDTQKKMIIDMAERENIEIIRFFEERRRKRQKH